MIFEKNHISILQFGGNKKPDANDDELTKLEELKLSLSSDSNEPTSTEIGKKEAATASPTASSNIAQPISTSHSRQSSVASSTTSSDINSRSMPINLGLGDCHRGLLVGLHRKMVYLLLF